MPGHEVGHEPVDPEDFLAVRHVADDRLFFDELVDVHEMISL